MEITACFPACCWLRFASRPWSLASVRLLPSERLTPSSIFSLVAHVSLLCHCVSRLEPAGRPLHCSRHWGLTGRCGQTFLRTDRCPPPHLPPPPSTPSLHHPASHCSSPPRGSHTTARSTGQTARHCAPCLRSLRAARGAGGWAAAKQLDFLLTAAAAFSPALPLGGISEISLSLRMRGSAQRRGCRATNRGREGGARTT